MLEHVQEHVGREYAKALAREPDWGAIRTICHDNDRLGNAEKFFIYPFGMVSPTTLRYLHHAVLVLKRLKTAGHSKVSIVEIGGGYGGLAYVFRRLAAHREVEVLSYTIIDLPEPRRLQQAYLQEVMGSLACYFWKAPEEASTLKYPPGKSCVASVPMHFRNSAWSNRRSTVKPSCRELTVVRLRGTMSHGIKSVDPTVSTSRRTKP